MTHKLHLSLRRIKKCRLRPLASSHLIPAAVYDRIRDGIISPFFVSHDAVLTSDRQLQAYLLCDECEHILSFGGEHYVVPLLGTHGLRFPLYELLKTHAGYAQLSEGMAEFHVSDDSPIQGKKIAHFALGVFWKAAAYPWKIGNEAANIDLGDYQEVLRLFLTGSIGWPGWAISLHIFISKPEQLGVLRTTVPAQFPPAADVRWYVFEVPGVLFVLNVGPGISGENRHMCFGSSPRHPIFVSDQMSTLRADQSQQRVNEVRKTASYLRAFEKRFKVKPPTSE